jgi:hypothetical protein
MRADGDVSDVPERRRLWRLAADLRHNLVGKVTEFDVAPL